MKIYDIDAEQFNNKPRAIALGNFDGFHIAHRQIINKLIKDSLQKGIESSILLFKDHTLKDLNKPVSILTTLEQKIQIAQNLGVSSVFIVSFDKIKDLSPASFLGMLKNKLGVKGIYVGYDYRFGSKGTGDIDTLKEYSNDNNLDLNILEPITDNHILVSSTKIRELIESNELQEAERMLGSKYFIQGKVVKGKQLGSKLGFPTANIEPLDSYVLPSPGVYFAQILVDGVCYNTATSVGKNITFKDEHEDKIEAHILGFNKNIYGSLVQLRFIKKIRGMIKFEDINDLKSQVLSDIKTISRLGEEYGSKKK